MQKARWCVKNPGERCQVRCLQWDLCERNPGCLGGFAEGMGSWVTFGKYASANERLGKGV